ncbi:MAG TPA: uroporphyrinogen-III C-methyltransferase [Acidobacteriaceae bacterium]|jgi:uroporphyrin-III C-methyltransferase|nr:uroporphyrinogen-III C-methyltransferase [Acidobacteriaceae bacterium]
MSKAKKGVVYLVGAGPGDPELLTLRAASLLASADVIFHDDLVPPAILDHAHPEAIVISVGKRCGNKRITQEEIHSLLIHAARSGQSVVRLKSGDPLVFGRAAEEMDALSAANIPFDVVPGITAAFAAAASLRTSFTDRRVASKIIFATGHQATHPSQLQNETTQENSAVWHGMLPEDATLVVYMPGRDYRALAENLLAQDVAADMPCVAVSCAGQPEQSISTTTLDHLAGLETGPAPVLLLIGRPMAVACQRNANHTAVIDESLYALAL